MSSMNTDIHKIAIVRLSALGDIVNSAVVLQFIKQFYPHVKIDWITEEMFAPLLENHPSLNSVHTLNLKKFKKEKSFALLWENIQKARSFGSYDLVIDMQGLLKSSIVARVVSPKTHGFDKESTRESIASFFYKTASHIAYDKNVVRRNCFVVSDALKFHITDDMILNKQAIFPIQKEFSLKNKKKNILLVIGASWQSKIYPKELLLKVCESLDATFYIVWGNKIEKSDAEWMENRAENIHLAPKLSLSELVSYISAMDLVIGNDTGPTHMAWAQNIPSITLFGPTNERMIYETEKNLSIKSNSKVDIFKINKNDFSIKNISPQLITTTAQRLLNGL